jgi:DNA invertase Pin-like site-specific DNA recombinase
MGKKVVVYARVSTNHQNVENQLQILREVAQKNDYEVVCEYLDES